MSISRVPTDADVAESRNSDRFVFRRAWQATFAGVPLRIIDISETGVQAEHSEAITIGKEGQVSLYLRPGAALGLPARIVWSRFGKGTTAGEKVYRSGLVLLAERSHVSKNVLDVLLRANDINFDAESLKKKELARSQRQKGVPAAPKTTTAAPIGNDASSDVIVARKARLWLRNNPQEAERWLSRARYARGSRVKAAYSLEELAVWELLDRKVDLTIIRLAFKLR